MPLNGAQYNPGEILSPSQASTYLACSAKWRFKYILGLPDPAGGGAVRGKAVHKAIEYYMRAKIEGVILDAADVLNEWDVMFDEASAEAEFQAYEDVDIVKASGATLAAKYLTEAAPAIDPAAVEVPLYGAINGVAVRGFADIITTDGTVIDIKTASRKPSGISPDHALQLATYVELYEGSNGNARIDSLVSTKDPQLIQIEQAPGAPGRQFIRRMYPMIVDAINGGLFMPSRSTQNCARCPYQRECCEEFGGSIQ
jgi:CRISPR/Cas system-associated exonuclease Cas4 (RecB family)